MLDSMVGAEGFEPPTLCSQRMATAFVPACPCLDQPIESWIYIPSAVAGTSPSKPVPATSSATAELGILYLRDAPTRHQPVQGDLALRGGALRSECRETKEPSAFISDLLVAGEHFSIPGFSWPFFASEDLLALLLPVWVLGGLWVGTVNSLKPSRGQVSPIWDINVGIPEIPERRNMRLPKDVLIVNGPSQV